MKIRMKVLLNIILSLIVQTAACASKNLEEKRLAVLKSDLEQTRQDLADLSRRENALVKQQSSMSVDLVAETKSRKSAEKNVRSLSVSFKSVYL